MMARDTVWGAMIEAFERGQGDLEDRLLGALEAAEREGGDLRGAQAAALTVVSATPSASPQLDRVVDLRIDDHPDPVAEIRRLLAYSRAHQDAHRARAKLTSGDAKAALATLDACCKAYPDDPEFLCLRGLALSALGRFDDARDMVQRAAALQPGWPEFLLRLADSGILPLRREQLAGLVSLSPSAAASAPRGPSARGG
jgi:Flp pilus assembly protein TadD